MTSRSPVLWTVSLSRAFGMPRLTVAFTGRGPCPMLNALANHGFFPRNGKNISIEQMIAGIDQALNLDPASSRPVVELAATTSTTGNPKTVNLADMAAHGSKSPSPTQPRPPPLTSTRSH